jgi:hypothetical protein
VCCCCPRPCACQEHPLLSDEVVCAASSVQARSNRLGCCQQHLLQQNVLTRQHH